MDRMMERYLMMWGKGIQVFAHSAVICRGEEGLGCCRGYHKDRCRSCDTPDKDIDPSQWVLWQALENRSGGNDRVSTTR